MVQSTVAPMPKMRARGSVTPSLEEVEAWLGRQPKRPRFVPIYREVMADTETPVSAFVKIKREPVRFHPAANFGDDDLVIFLKPAAVKDHR